MRWCLWVECDLAPLLLLLLLCSSSCASSWTLLILLSHRPLMELTTPTMMMSQLSHVT